MSEEAGFGSEVMGDIGGVAETVGSGVESVVDGAHGNWDGAADHALSMSEGALGVATGGLFTAAESGLDAVSHALGGPSMHDAINSGAQQAGDAIGDGMFDLVGADQSHQAAVSFDDGDILGGLGHMATGAGETAVNAVESGAEAVGGAVAEGAEAVGGAVAQGVSDLGDAASSAADSVAQGAEDLYNAL